MDSSRLSSLLDNTYVPPRKVKRENVYPSYHPCLIVQDLQTDVNKLKPCGCHDVYCIKNAPAWIPRSGK